MSSYDHTQYQPFAFAPQKLYPSFTRTWPNHEITRAPIWASVDLRDGNQSLIDPMTIEQKLTFFDTLLKCGFKEIEVGFPAAAQVEFDFMRRLINENLIPDDVTVQVLVQAREHLIARTFESLEGCKQAVVHVYNSTSRVQRTKVFARSKDEIKQIAVEGAQLVKDYAARYPDTQWTFQYSPESFTQTEPDYAVEVCEAVCRVWQPETGQKVILNLPATVEATTPNVFADQVEYFCQNLASRKDVIISLHTHNDRGCAVAAAELGVMAGADRIEGTLFGNGERTGNMDIVTMALNLYSQGVDPELDFSRMGEIAQVVKACNNLPIHPRHPYVGELVFTAFSGSHQDAIKKSLEYDEREGSDHWDVAYLPIDPRDISRSYQDVVRINSQSGKGGVAYILKRDFGFDLPRWLQVDFSQVVQREAEAQARELSSDEILELFNRAFLNDSRIQINDYSAGKQGAQHTFSGEISLDDQTHAIKGESNGPLSAFLAGIKSALGVDAQVVNFSEHALGQGSDAVAAAYLQLSVKGEVYSGIGTDTSTTFAMLKACTRALAKAI